MKKLIIICCLMPVLAAAVSTWKNYPISTPDWCRHMYALAVNMAGDGCAFMGDGVSSGKEYALKLHNGVWSPCAAPPVMLARPSISPDGTIYSTSSGENNHVYRFEGNNWKWVAASARFGQFGFSHVAAVGPHEFWTLGSTREGMVMVVYFQNDQPVKIFDLGPFGDGIFPPVGDIVVPREASPAAVCYVVIRADEMSFKPGTWLLFVVQADGSKQVYEFPANNEPCDGMSAYRVGNVHIMLTPLGGPSRLFGFADGVWREIVTFSERVRLADYAGLSDGWGFNSVTNRVYHWTGGAITPAVALDGNISCLGMVGPTEGWAGGSRIINGVYTPAMWHYFDVEPSLTPTSLGRVKAAFR